jgi:hypothetical protein
MSDGWLFNQCSSGVCMTHVPMYVMFFSEPTEKPVGRSYSERSFPLLALSRT